jgi:hypothetical protein
MSRPPTPEWLAAPVLAAVPGLVHGFTTRRGGESPPPFGEQNHSHKWPEDLENVSASRRRLGAAAGFDPDRLFLGTQVHGADGLLVDAQTPTTVARARVDFLVTRTPGQTVGVITADCVPVLIAHPGQRTAAAVHAGWRGMVAGVIDAAIAALGAPPGELVAAFGPSIGPCCFEVGPEVVAAFATAFPEAPGVIRPAGPGPRPHVDLWAAARAALRRAGVPEAAQERVGGCTHCDPARFHSYRRTGARVGQHLAFIGFTNGSSG